MAKSKHKLKLKLTYEQLVEQENAKLPKPYPFEPVHPEPKTLDEMLENVRKLHKELGLNDDWPDMIYYGMLSEKANVPHEDLGEWLGSIGCAF